MTMPDPAARLPIEDALPELLAALAAGGVAVLRAPPGAGKTTRVPLAMLPHVAGRIVMLEPRRLAARAAADAHGRDAGRAGRRAPSATGCAGRRPACRGATRIEVVTEGILTRMIQSDPGLAGIGALVFDEFHERSLQRATWGWRWPGRRAQALRPDLMRWW